jgi:uncharacterized tellurite resistance protein B-like protein
MDPLAWLGLSKGRPGTTHLSAIHAKVKALLPEDESVVHRYIVTVAVLLTRVAQSDGQVRPCEFDRLGVLFRHIDRMPSEGVESLCNTLNATVPQLTASELDLCYRELKSLCDADERLQVMRLLASQATVDGIVAPMVHSELMSIATALDVPSSLLEQLEVDALTSEAPPIAIEDLAEQVPHRG